MKPIEPSRLVDTIRGSLPRTHGTSAALGAGRRLLAVDDDPVLLKLTRIRFSQLGFTVTAATSAAEALAIARATPPDIILSDVFMPGVDGFQFCLAVRDDPALAEIPVVLWSGQYGSEADQEMARQVGANALVGRTPDFANAIAAIREAIEAGASPRVEKPSDALKLNHAGLVIRRLERQVEAMGGLAQQCSQQAAQLALLSGVADALTHRTNIDATLRDVLAATLDAAGISKGALILRDAHGALVVRQAIGFSATQRAGLDTFFGYVALLDSLVDTGGSVSIPSPSLPEQLSRDILGGASVASVHIVPLVHDGRGMGAMIIGASSTDVTTVDSVAFARAMGNQVLQSLELTKSVARLAASEERYRKLLESANDAIAVLTPDGIVREMNQRWAEILGVPKEQLIGRHVRDFAPPGKEEENLSAYNVAAAAAATRVRPVEIARPDGSRVLLEFSSTAIDVGSERLVLTIGRDITEQRLLEDQLRQAQKLEAIGQLAGGIAHDFNNVLTAIMGFCELLAASHADDDPRRADVLEIKRAGERAVGLTQQLLAFGRKQILQPKVLDVNAVITGLEPLLRRLLLEHVELLLTLAPDAGLVKIDPTQFEQILVNLAVNAEQAMPLGGKLTIATARVASGQIAQQLPRRAANGDYVMLAVADTGVGMDERTKEHIFAPFFTTKEVGKGTGLGLSTVHGIVKQSGGEIRVESEPGRGATFRIYLPRVVREMRSAIRRPAAAEDSPHGSETILLVEDDEAVRRLARVSLERLGYRVVQAANPKEAIGVAEEMRDTIHLLVSDVIMPESDGLPLFERLVKIHPRARVLYISGYADDAIVRHGVLVEGTPFLQKPFTPQTFARKVRDVLDAPPPAGDE